MSISAKTKLCLVIGDPIRHSLGPQMHNAAFKELDIDDEYVYIACNVSPDSLGDFIGGVRAMGIRGVSCTIPHKTAVMKYLDSVDPVAEAIGAVNTIVNDGGVLTGYNTDWLGVVIPLEQLGPLKDKKVALLGAGGAARAIAYGLTERGARLTIYNRTLEKARELAEEFKADASSLNALEAIKGMNIIVNASSVGLHPNSNATPIGRQLITNRQIVFDIVYAPYETRLLREAKQQGAQVIHGTEMLLQQGMAQFKLFTGHDAPEDTMRRALRQALGDGGGDL